MIEVRRAADRFETAQPGITTWHCLSSGSHYDPGNTAFGSLIALDEHAVAPGAGFARHSHRGVEILTWVLTGALRHEDSTGRVDILRTGTVLHQCAGSGIEHVETNASDTDALRFVQLILIAALAAPRQRLAAPPVELGDGQFAALVPTRPIELAAAPHVALFVSRGSVTVAGQPLRTGDSARVRDASVTVQGHGEVLVWRSLPGRLDQ